MLRCCGLCLTGGACYTLSDTPAQPWRRGYVLHRRGVKTPHAQGRAGVPETMHGFLPLPSYGPPGGRGPRPAAAAAAAPGGAGQPAKIVLLQNSFLLYDNNRARNRAATDDRLSAVAHCIIVEGDSVSQNMKNMLNVSQMLVI